MDRRSFLKKTVLGTGALIVGGVPAVTQIAKASEKRDIPVFGPDLKTAGGRKHTPFVKAPKRVKAGD